MEVKKEIDIKEEIIIDGEQFGFGSNLKWIKIENVIKEEMIKEEKAEELEEPFIFDVEEVVVKREKLTLEEEIRKLKEEIAVKEISAFTGMYFGEDEEEPDNSFRVASYTDQRKICDISKCEGTDSETEISIISPRKIVDTYEEMWEKSNSPNKNMFGNSKLKPSLCKMCLKYFDKRDYLRQTILHPDIRTSCNICRKPFPRKFDVKQNMSPHFDEKPVCKICKIPFEKHFLLRHHMFLHSDEKPLKCETCQKSFKGKYYLRKHVQRH